MSGVEIALPVLAAVFALVSAFKDGGTIAEKLKERRRRKNALPPNERLYTALKQGPLDIERSRLEGMEEFGNEYGADAETASKLKDVTIVLQDAIIRQIAYASENDDMVNFTPAITSINQARMRAVRILNDHLMDLQNRRTQGPSSGLGVVIENSPAFGQGQQHSRVQTLDTVASGLPSPDTRSSPPPPAHHHHRHSSSHGTAPHPDSETDASQALQPRPRRGMWNPFARRTSISAPPEQPPPRLSLQSPPPSNVASPEERPTRAPSLQTTSPALTTLPSPALRRTSTVVSAFESSGEAREIIPICEENKFAGLCKCAYRAQNYKFDKAMGPSMREFEWMYHCKKCKYRLMADSAQRGSPHFDDRIQTSSSAINFRCMFLFKSHVAAKSGDQRRYLCLLCLLTGRTSKIHDMEDQLFGHIMLHAGESMVMKDGRHVVLQGMIEVQSDGITNATMESFDIYFPLALQQSTGGNSRPQSSFTMLPESAMRAGSDANEHDGGGPSDYGRSLSPSTFMSNPGGGSHNNSRAGSRQERHSVGTTPPSRWPPSNPSPVSNEGPSGSHSPYHLSTPPPQSPRSSGMFSELPAPAMSSTRDQQQPMWFAELDATGANHR